MNVWVCPHQTLKVWLNINPRASPIISMWSKHCLTGRSSSSLRRTHCGSVCVFWMYTYSWRSASQNTQCTLGRMQFLYYLGCLLLVGLLKLCRKKKNILNCFIDRNVINQRANGEVFCFSAPHVSHLQFQKTSQHSHAFLFLLIFLIRNCRRIIWDTYIVHWAMDEQPLSNIESVSQNTQYTLKLALTRKEKSPMQSL